MAINSKAKGKQGELEFCRIMRDYGYDVHRSAQYCGNTGDAPDVIGLPGLHPEIKRVEKLSIYDAIEQAKRDAKDGKLPAVFHRKNNAEWLVTMPLDCFMEIYKEWKP